jgi:hypothetical protein
MNTEPIFDRRNTMHVFGNLFGAGHLSALRHRTRQRYSAALRVDEQLGHVDPLAFAFAVRTAFASLWLAAWIAFAHGALGSITDGIPAPLLPSCANAVNGAVVAANAATNPI